MSLDALAVPAAATVFLVMFTLGLGIAPREFRWLRGHPGLVARGLFSVLVAVPVMAVAVEQAFDLPRSVRIGIALMAIAPGAPVALRNSLVAGGHRAFAPAIQVLVALLAAVSMPLSVAVLNRVYDGHASLDPVAVGRQVFLAQLLPLGAGMLLRDRAPGLASIIEPWAARLSVVALIALVAMVALLWRAVAEVGPWAAVAVVVITMLALAIGHLLGGPDPATRTAVAITSAARNPGLALLVATLNNAPPEAGRIVLAYLVVSAATIIPYVVWRRRVAPGWR